MTHFDTRKELNVNTDASPTGLGSVLVQTKGRTASDLGIKVTHATRGTILPDREGKTVCRVGISTTPAVSLRTSLHVGDRQQTVVTSDQLVQTAAGASCIPCPEIGSLKLAEYHFAMVVRRPSQIPVADWLSRLPAATSVTASKEQREDVVGDKHCAVQVHDQGGDGTLASFCRCQMPCRINTEATIARSMSQMEGAEKDNQDIRSGCLHRRHHR